MSGKVRGPFISSFYNDPWPEIFLGMLTKHHVLAGPMIDCHPECYCDNPVDVRHMRKSGSRHCNRRETRKKNCTYTVALDFSLVAFDRGHAVYSIVQQVLGDGEWTDDMLYDDVLFAQEVSRKVLEDGYSFEVTTGLWMGVDFNQISNVNDISSVYIILHTSSR